ncbi:fumarylacetoacetate hydrolase family protein [Curvibacter sp. APW13]|uniref:fumarylacetoacetate hydrolase family protein n=1 Tax=Curvibacter sp. APW13 TaxID=3077236 RepID=UPI0028DE296D|nr:fumarylacetoacetate hydrolase family protein [Curvibacter sp. APW13]MDT8990816.1 fumarylacetoacetate hydrolase family protein [Curvibacter sp. APW13]
MKLASYSDGSRDGQLVVVSRDLTQAHYATHVATRLQAVLEDWNFLAPQLQDLYDSLNAGRCRQAFAFDPERCMAPLPRSYHHVQACAYADVAAAGAPQRLASTVQAGDGLWGPHAVVAPAHAALGLDFEAQWGVITSDVPVAASPERALDAVRLVVLCQSMVLRSGDGGEQEARLGTACAPVAMTPDELGPQWERGRLQASLVTHWNGRKLGMSDTAVDMVWPLGKVISQLVAWRPLSTGSLVTLGPVRNLGEGAPGAQRPKGFHALADKRALELAQDGQATTTFLQAGDDVSSELRGRDGASLCGTVRCEVAASPD